MGDKSAIEWTDATWNPVTGCTKISAGCDNCYAERLAERFRGTPGHPFEHGFDLTLRPKRLEQPLRWETPRRIFVNSMSDLFHRDVPTDFIEQVFAVMDRAHWHQFQVLTKRPEIMQRYMERQYGSSHVVPPNIWLGVSVEEAKVKRRIDVLRFTPARMRFLSIEPLIGPLGELDLSGIHWVIVGGESGPGARPMNPDWAREIRDQCVAQGVAFFMKQMSSQVKARMPEIPSDLMIRQMPQAEPEILQRQMCQQWWAAPLGDTGTVIHTKIKRQEIAE